MIIGNFFFLLLIGNFLGRNVRLLVNQIHQLLFVCFCCCCLFFLFVWLFLIPMAQIIKNLPAMQETWIQYLGQEDPLESEMATHSSILAWRSPRTEEPGRLQSVVLQRVGQGWATNTFIRSKARGISPSLGPERLWFWLSSRKKPNFKHSYVDARVLYT